MVDKQRKLPELLAPAGDMERLKMAVLYGADAVYLAAKPTILEPIGLLKVTIPDANLGDIMSDISSKRRGTVLGMTAEDGMQTVEAEVPMAEMGSYTIDLRSMTQGRGSFSCKFVRYEEAPGNVQQKVIEEAKKEQEA